MLVYTLKSIKGQKSEGRLLKLLHFEQIVTHVFRKHKLICVHAGEVRQQSAQILKGIDVNW